MVMLYLSEKSVLRDVAGLASKDILACSTHGAVPFQAGRV
jgi:hypothetical protein